MDVSITTLDGAEAGTLTLSDEIFGLEPRADILQRVVRWQLAKRQQGTHQTKGRSEIDRTKKKLYKQKGTGNARHGAASAPQFRGGGRAFGPVTRSHAHDLPKKVRALGLRHALSAKAKDQSLIVVDQVVSDDPDLILPHPRAHERAFVLLPWAEIDPDALLPGYGPVMALLDAQDRADIEMVGHVG